MHDLDDSDLEQVTAGREKAYIAAASIWTTAGYTLEAIIGPWKSPRR